MKDFRLNAKQLRTVKPDHEIMKSLKKNSIYLILDNVLDTYNIGAIFRLADATATRKIYLCGETETPPNPRIKKASVNTWQWVDWEYSANSVEVMKRLRREVHDIRIYALEQHPDSISYARFKPHFPLAIIIGNETYGISASVLKKADQIIELPMFGVNKSLNVMVSCGIILYKILEQIKR